jgi:hypothetical protein
MWMRMERMGMRMERRKRVLVFKAMPAMLRGRV